MKIKQTYKFLTYDNFKTIGFIMLIVFGVNILGGIIVMSFTEVSGGFVKLMNDVTPSFSVMTLVFFIYTLALAKPILATGNQFGRTRLSTMLSSALSMMTVIAAFALLASLAGMTYLTSGNEILDLYKGSIPKGELFVKDFFWIFSSLFNTYAVASFIISIWNRVRPRIRALIFVGIPVLMAMLIPRIVLSTRITGSKIADISLRISNLFGYSSKFGGFGYSTYDINVLRNFLSTTFIISIPLLLLAYAISRRTTLNDKKN
ncbi:MAG: hypothetical protein WCS04_04705 [Sphaerochaetaceae bacterium]